MSASVYSKAGALPTLPRSGGHVIETAARLGPERIKAIVANVRRPSPRAPCGASLWEAAPSRGADTCGVRLRLLPTPMMPQARRPRSHRRSCKPLPRVTAPPCACLPTKQQEPYLRPPHPLDGHYPDARRTLRLLAAALSDALRSALGLPPVYVRLAAPMSEGALALVPLLDSDLPHFKPDSGARRFQGVSHARRRRAPGRGASCAAGRGGASRPCWDASAYLGLASATRGRGPLQLAAFAPRLGSER